MSKPTTRSVRIRLRQRICHQRVRENAAQGSEEASSARGNDDELLATFLSLKGHRRRMAVGLERCFPELLARLHIKCSEAAIGGPGNEHQTSGRDYRAAQVLCAGIVDSFGLEFVNYSERHAPDKLAFV